MALSDAHGAAFGIPPTRSDARKLPERVLRSSIQWRNGKPGMSAAWTRRSTRRKPEGGVSKKKQQTRKKTKAAGSRRVVWWIGSLFLFFVVAAVGYRLWHGPSAGIDSSRLAGRWQRPDGGYVLEIRDIGPNGQANAAYLNPRPIHVARAEWKEQGGLLQLFVELRDVNYPGSTYTLTYDAAADRLEGIYYQAALRQTFDVVFERMQ